MRNRVGSRLLSKRGRVALPFASTRPMAAVLAVVVVALVVAMPASALPDGRRYELVTPATKVAEPASQLDGLYIGTTDDGNSLVFHSDLPLVGDTPDQATLYRADRTADGWATVPVLPKGRTPSLPLQLFAFSSDAERLVAGAQDPFVDADTNSVFGLYGGQDLYGLGPGPAAALLTPNLNPGGVNDSLKTLLATADDGRAVVFYNTQTSAENNSLLPVAASTDHQALYEFRDGVLRDVALDDAGVPLTTGPVYLGNGVNAGGQAELINANAYSRDGSRIFFTAETEGSASDRPGLYVRRDGSHTDPIPASPAGANADSQFLGATPDGRVVFIRTVDRLTADDQDSSADLYAYNVDDHSAVRLSAGAADADVQELPVWSSDDGARVFFTATGQLIPGRGSVSGPKTYLWDHGTVSLVADAGLIPAPYDFAINNVRGLNYGGFECGPTRATPDGRYFLALTTASLLPSDQDGGAADVYRYDVERGAWTLISTGPTDDQGSEDAAIDDVNPYPNTGIPLNCNVDLRHLTHPLSDDGRFVFFETRAALVPGDINGQYDVYQWDARTGKTSLITSGRGADGSDLLDETPSGSDVFVSTRDRLVRQDTDDYKDFYDARIGGGFPEAPPVVPCKESECQGAPSAEPTIPVPGSLALTAPSPNAEVRTAGQVTIRKLSRHRLRRLSEGHPVQVTVVAAGTGRLTISGAVRAGRQQAAMRSVAASATAGKPVTAIVRLTTQGRRLVRQHRRVVLRLVAHQIAFKDATVTYVLRDTKGASR